jgi:hypothetical protein
MLIENKDSGAKIHCIFDFISKYCHPLFLASCFAKMESGAASPKCTRDTEKLMEGGDIQRANFIRIFLQMRIYTFKKECLPMLLGPNVKSP